MRTMTKLALAGMLGVAVAAGTAGTAWAWGPHGGMGGGMGGGMWGGRGGCGERETPLTTTQVRDIIEGKLAWRGEDLKVGKVEEAGGKIVAEVVNSDGTLARRVQVDPKTGRFSRAE